MELVQLLLALWRERYWVLAASILPALAIGLMIYSGSRAYTLNLEYNLTLDAVAYKKLMDRFYSSPNVASLARALDAEGQSLMAEGFRRAEGRAGLEQILSMGVTPAYIDFANKEKLRISLERSWADNIAKLENLRAELLTIYLKGSSKEQVEILAKIIRANFERDLPLYNARDELVADAKKLNEKLAQFQATRKKTKLYFETLNQTHTALTKLKDRPFSANGLDFELKIDSPQKASAFLPLNQQLTALESEIARHGEQIKAAERVAVWQERIARLNGELRELLDTNLEQGFGLEEFLNELRRLVEQETEESERNYLSAQIRKMENLALDRQSTIRETSAVPQPRNTVRKTAILFIVLLAMSLLIVALREYIRLMRAKSSLI